MSLRFSQGKIAACLTFVAVLALSGCYQTLPSNWHTNLPGAYEGTWQDFREVIELKSDGSFQHQVFKGGTSILTESGKWSVPSGKYEVTLDAFTEFFDRQGQKFLEKGQRYVGYQLWPLPEGNRFNKLSPSVNFEYLLVRKK